MDRRWSDKTERIGSVKATANHYGEILVQGRKLDMPHHQQATHQDEELNSKTRDLHHAKLGVGRLNDCVISTEKERARAELELHRAKRAAKQLALQIQESKAKAMARKLELQTIGPSPVGEMSEHQYWEVMQELTRVKQELGRLKIDVASATQVKMKAEKDIDASGSKARACENSAGELRREIEDADEELVLVELARIEAEKEFREMEDQRNAEAAQFNKNMGVTKKRIRELRIEIKRARELQVKLAMTASDVNVLQTEMELVRAMENNFNHTDYRAEEKEQSIVSLQSVEAELKVAKKELASIKEEGFNFMTAMDLARNKLMHLTKETEQLKKLEKKSDSTLHHYNSKLLKAKSKLETASVADERTRAIVSNLSTALQQLVSDIDAAKEEKESLAEETKSIRMEIGKSVLSTDAAEERLRAAMQELDAVKASEAMAMGRLKIAAERATKARGSSFTRSSAITISKWEYDYLSRRAAAAQEVADSKVAAAHAWIEALKAEEKEMAIEVELVQKEIKQLIAVNTEKSPADQEQTTMMVLEMEAELARPPLAITRPRKSMRESGSVAASPRMAYMRRSSASLGTRQPARSPAFTIKKRGRLMPNLVLLLKRRRNRKQK